MLKNWESMLVGSATIRFDRPTVVPSTFADDSTSFISLLEASPQLHDSLIEVRYDRFSGRSDRDLERILGYLNQLGYNYIFTFRSTNRSETEKYYGIATQSSVPAIDVDLSQVDWVPEHPVKIISYHGEEGSLTPELVMDLSKQDASIVKIAIHYTSREQFLSDLVLLSKYFERTRKPVCFSPMGASPIMRVIAAYFLSDLIYSSYGTPTAEGQLPLEKISPLLEMF